MKKLIQDVALYRDHDVTEHQNIAIDEIGRAHV